MSGADPSFCLLARFITAEVLLAGQSGKRLARGLFVRIQQMLTFTNFYLEISALVALFANIVKLIVLVISWQKCRNIAPKEVVQNHQFLLLT